MRPGDPSGSSESGGGGGAEGSSGHLEGEARGTQSPCLQGRREAGWWVVGGLVRGAEVSQKGVGENVMSWVWLQKALSWGHLGGSGRLSF